MVFPPEPTIIHRPFNHLMPWPVEVNGTEPRPVQLNPSSEVATVFPPEPTATNLGEVDVPEEATANTDVLKT